MINKWKDDIYFDINYAKLYEKNENGKAIKYEYSSDSGSIIYIFIKRIIPNCESYYDIVSPYGYSGPLIIKVVTGKKELLVREFEVAFSKYCKKNNIVSEFVVFHPLANNADDFKSIYFPVFYRKTLVTDIKGQENPLISELSTSCKKHIRKVYHRGVKFRITVNPTNISKFKEIYYSTMERNNASAFYYFDESYFDKCLSSFKDKVLFLEAIYEEKTIAAGLYFLSANVIHAHLCGTLSDYLYLSPSYVLYCGIIKWAIENGVECIHYGGGLSTSEDDDLFKFKKQFAKNHHPSVYIGKKIWNKKVYAEICCRAKVSTSESFFPAYRSNIW